MSKKTKLLIIVGIEAVVIIAILLIIFFAGRKIYTVRFDLDGGTLISGDLEQSVLQGNNATPPVVTKDGCFFLEWSVSYKKITKNMTITAVWEYTTTPGIEYEYIPNSNYCLISGCYKDLTGEVYIGAYYKKEDENGKTNNIKVLGIKDNAFKDCKRITRLYFLDGIISIGDNAFENCTSLKIIDIPDSVVNIGNGAFKNCTSLIEASLPLSLDSIGEEAFANCKELNTLIIPKKVKTIKDNAFLGCDSLKMYSESLEKVNSWSNNYNPLNLHITYGVKHLTLPDNSKIIYVINENETYTLLKYHSDNEIVILENKIIIEDKEYEIERIEALAFKECPNATHITIPKEVKSIGEAILYKCERLESLTIPFVGEKRGNTDSYKALFGYLFVCEENDNYVTQVYGENEEISFAIPESLEEINITDEIVIATGAFSNLENIVKITLPMSINTIESKAFLNCLSLKSIEIPIETLVIGADAFKGCKVLVIKTAVSEKLEGWNENWNSDDCQVKWN